MPQKKQPVSLNIKNPEVHRTAARLAKIQGTTITEAVLKAVRAELGRQEPRGAADEVHRMEQYARRLVAMPLLDDRPADEILGYEAEGYLGGG